MPTKKELTPIERKLIVEKRNKGEKFTEIAGKDLFLLINFLNLIFTAWLGIAPSTASKNYKKYKNKEVFSVEKNSGRPKKVSEREEKNIIKLSKNNPFMSSIEICNDFNECHGKEISKSTVRRILSRNGLKSFIAKKKPLLTKKMANKRMDFCKKYGNEKEDFWSRVIFTDESTISINPGFAMQRVRRYSISDPYVPKYIRPTIKHPISVMVWGSMCSSGIGNLYICEKYMNAEEYVKVLESNFFQSANMYGLKEPILQDDSAPCHRAKKVQDFKINNGIVSLDWPGNSPDLNPIENLWTLVKRKVAKRICRNKIELVNAIKKVWNEEITSDVCYNLVHSMKRRIQKCKKVKGFITKY